MEIRMPEIKFILVRCPHCGEEYRVRLGKIREGQSFECLACGTMVALSEFISLVQALLDYSKVVLEVEKHGKVDGEVLIPKRKANSIQG